MNTTEKLVLAARDVCSARDPEWADANVSMETAADTLADALAEHDAQASDPTRALVLRAALTAYASRETRGADADARMLGGETIRVQERRVRATIATKMAAEVSP